jgi:hypothetical protein
MSYPTTSGDLRRRRLFVIGVAIVVLALAFIAYAVLVNRAHSTPGARPATRTEPSS